jgi:hypothetical protein
MAQRVDLRALLVAAGAVLLAVSLFVDWFEPDLTAWASFELVDLVLAAIAVAALWSAASVFVPGRAPPERLLPALAASALVLVAAQLLDPPPTADGESREPGAWLALGGALLIALGALLTAARVSLALTFERRPARPLRAQARAPGRSAPGAPPPRAGQRVRADDEPTTPLPKDPGQE